MGRPEKPIDWDRVDNLLLSGCTGIEIAPFFDMHFDTFYKRFQEHHNIGFTVYAQSKKQQGNALLKEKSFDDAMAGSDKQLTLNLKNRCGYHEGKQEAEIPNDNSLNVLIEELKSFKGDINALESKANQ